MSGSLTRQDTLPGFLPSNALEYSLVRKKGLLRSTSVIIMRSVFVIRRGGSVLTEMLGKWLGVLWDAVAPSLPAMATSFLSVLVGALPFIVIAAFASAVLEVFVSKDAIARLVPRTGFWGVLLAPFYGLFIPMCECGIVPVARRMVQKGVPGSTAITFMLANPIWNPLAIYATYLAFPFARNMVVWRLALGYLVAVIIGLIIHYALRDRAADAILHESLTVPVAAAAERHQHCDCGHDHSQDHGQKAGLGAKLQACVDHAATEFFDVLKYFILGSGLAAISQALIDRQMLEAIGGGAVMSVLVMIAFAFVICICSEADAFVAATFASTFTPGALLAFLVAGPMTDIKNTMMMSAAFRKRFVWSLNALIIGLTALAAISFNLVSGWGG